MIFYRFGIDSVGEAIGILVVSCSVTILEGVYLSYCLNNREK